MAQPAPRYVVEVAWNANPLSDPAGWAWTDETARLRNQATWSNGKQSPLQRSETCRGRFEFDDRDRYFDPNNTAARASYPGVTKGKRPIRVRALWTPPAGAPTYYPQYQGYFNRAVRNRDGRDATALVESAGLLGLLATAKLPASPVEAEIRNAAPAGWWRMSEQKLGDVVADQAGRYPGRIEGEPQLGQPCVPVTDQGGGMYFDEDGSKRVRVPSAAGIVTGYPFSVTGWFRAPRHPTAYRTLFALWAAGGSYPAYSVALSYTGYLGDTPPTDWGGVLIGEINAATRLFTSERTWDDDLAHCVTVQFLSQSSIVILVDGAAQTIAGYGGAPGFIAPAFVTIGNETPSDSGDFRSYAVQADWQVYNRTFTAGEHLAQYQAGATGWAGDTSGARAIRVLDRAGVHANLRSIDNGNTVLQGGLLVGGNPAEYLQTIAKSEAGGLYETKAGVLRLRQRLALLNSPYTVSQATFGNAGGAEVPFEKLQPVNGTDRLVNRARIGRTGGTVAERFDQASIDANGEAAVEATDLLFASDNVAADYATWLVARYGQPVPEFQTFTLAPDAGDDGMTAQALGRQLEDRVTIKDRPPGGGTVTQDALLLGETWTLTRGAARVQWFLAKTDDTQYFTLNDATKGKLNGGYPLAF